MALTNEDKDDGDEQAENLLSTKKICKNDFIFLKVVGRGSFGKVYLVKKKDKPDQPLALKVLSKDVVSKRNLMIKTQGKLVEFLLLLQPREISQRRLIVHSSSSSIMPFKQMQNSILSWTSSTVENYFSTCVKKQSFQSEEHVFTLPNLWRQLDVFIRTESYTETLNLKMFCWTLMGTLKLLTLVLASRVSKQAMKVQRPTHSVEHQSIQPLKSFRVLAMIKVSTGGVQ